MSIEAQTRRFSARRARKLGRFQAGVAVVGLLLPAAAAAQTATTPAAIPQNVQEDIVVTANRREERLQDVPIQITAFSAARLEQQGVRGEQDLQASVPSLVVGPNGQASRDAPSFTLRGLGATFQASPGVAVYMAEVPLPSPITLSQQGGPGNFVDIENLQVLAGPQGTLFGRNTTGGAVLIVPQKPVNRFEGWVQSRFGNYSNAEVEGAINVPVIDDKLIVRVAGAYHDRDGYTHDVVWDKNRDDTHWYSGRVGILARPVEGVENYLIVYGSYSRNNGAGLINRGFNIPYLAAAGLCSDALGTPYPSSCGVYRAATAQADALGPRATALSNDVGQRTKTGGAINNTSVDLSDTLTLRNIVSYQAFKGYFSYDGDATPLQQHEIIPTYQPAPGTVTLPGSNIPVTYLNATGTPELPRDDFRTITEEFQLQGKGLANNLNYTVGAFYFDQKPVGVQGGRAITYCPSAFTGFCPADQSFGGVRQTSKALYAQGTLDFGAFAPALKALRFTAGYRHTWDIINGFSTRYIADTAKPGNAVCETNGLSVPMANAYSACQFSARLPKEANTWTFGLDYRVSNALMVFGKVSRGYKSGGFNPYAVFTNTLTFEPEFVTDYEIGFKSNYRVGNMPTQLNLTVYDLNFKGIQRATGDFNPSTGAVGAKTVNADARIRGIELDASVHPAPWLEIGGNFSYTDAKYTKYSFIVNGFYPQQSCDGPVVPGSSANMKCLPFQYVAPYIWSVHAAIDLPLGDKIGKASLFVNYSHTASQYTDAAQLELVQPGARIGAFGLLNVSLDLKNVGGTNFDVGAFATNLTNTLYRTSNTDVYQAGGLLYSSTLYGEPRMYGLKLRYSFGEH